MSHGRRSIQLSIHKGSRSPTRHHNGARWAVDRKGDGMNGKRRKALQRQFRELNGRAPLPAITVLVDNKEIFVNKDGVKQFEAGYDHYGELYFRKVMGVGQVSEKRALKRSYRAPSY